MPAYIKLCMYTWKVPCTVLNYDNLSYYTDLRVTPSLTRFSLPQIADVVRVHVLRDQGGYWLDADTIMVTGKLPDANMIGDPVERTNTIGYLRTDPHSDMYTEWAEYQDGVIRNANASHHWSVMGNDFTDAYVKSHPEITICSVANCWPETYMIKGDILRHEKYFKLYFEENYRLSDFKPTDMLMLHNSWTPDWYKNFSEHEVMAINCTLSNVLKDVLIKM